MKCPHWTLPSSGSAADIRLPLPNLNLSGLRENQIRDALCGQTKDRLECAGPAADLGQLLLVQRPELLGDPDGEPEQLRFSRRDGGSDRLREGEPERQCR